VWLRGVFVVPEETGRGAGQRLVASVLAEVQATGRRRVDLLATLNAVPFYRRLGWRSIRAVSLPMDAMPRGGRPGAPAKAGRRVGGPRGRRLRPNNATPRFCLHSSPAQLLAKNSSINHGKRLTGVRTQNGPFAHTYGSLTLTD
jgi:hypothetical protein